MPDIIRSRECIVFLKGETQTVVVHSDMVSGGWPGAQGVRWIDSSVDERTVTYSDGLFGGFLVWGSDEPGDDYASMTRSMPTYRYATFFSGNNVLSTSSYERYTYASRVGPGPLVPLVYAANEPLYFSSRGLWTREDEMTLSGHPMAPALSVGFVAQVPKAVNNQFLGIQTTL